MHCKTVATLTLSGGIGDAWMRSCVHCAGQHVGRSWLAAAVPRLLVLVGASADRGDMFGLVKTFGAVEMACWECWWLSKVTCQHGGHGNGAR